MKRVALLTAALLAGQLYASEPSAFGAGNLDSSAPYGLTQTEKKIVETREDLQNAKRKALENSAQLQSIRERLDGLQTIIEGLSEKAQSNKRMVSELEREKTLSAQRDEKIAALEASVQAQQSSLEAMKSVMETMAAQLDRVTADYVSKEEFNRLVNEVNAFKGDLSKTLKHVATAPAEDPYALMSSATLAKKAKQNYDKLYFRKAIPMYEELIRRNYKPAYAHFMIGEMWHYRKNWSKALAYFKESAKRYDKTPYMPKLMLHSAECMVHLGDTGTAEKFLRSLIAKYPNAPEADEAQRMLNAL